MGGFPSGQRGQTVNLLAMPSKVRILLRPFDSVESDNIIIAGWSSLEARRAHNPKVVGSNPAPAIHKYGSTNVTKPISRIRDSLDDR